MPLEHKFYSSDIILLKIDREIKNSSFALRRFIIDVKFINKILL